MAGIKLDKLSELHGFVYMDKIAEEQESIKKAISELPSPFNKVFEEYFINETPTQEIITGLHLTRNKFYKHLEQGKILLRQRLNNGIYDKAKEVLYGKVD